MPPASVSSQYTRTGQRKAGCIATERLIRQPPRDALRHWPWEWPGGSCQQGPQPGRCVLQMLHRTGGRKAHEVVRFAGAAEIAPGRDGDMRLPHDFKSEVPAVLDPQPAAQIRTIRPGVEGAVGHHGHIQPHVVEGWNEIIAPRL